jgi:hypothetical protein
VTYTSGAVRFTNYLLSCKWFSKYTINYKIKICVERNYFYGEKIKIRSTAGVLIILRARAVPNR